MTYPAVRLRRLRENPILRKMIEETSLSVHDLVMPIFVKEGLWRPVGIESMPGQYQLPVSHVSDQVKKIAGLGVPAVILFGIPSKKDVRASAAHAVSGVIPKAVRAIKKSRTHVLVMTDVCLCEYHSHGHCGHVSAKRILNDVSVKSIARVALTHARAGADLIAPSDMMDGRIGAVRRALDGANFQHLPIMSYAVKYASAFYAPFREAAENAPAFGDRGSYQMNAKNRREAFREAEEDVKEGADILLVKPALSYLDIIRGIRDKFNVPVAAFSVSGEYAMIKAAAQKGWLDEEKIVLESHLAMKRAGATLLLTYWAMDLARVLRKKRGSL